MSRKKERKDPMALIKFRVDTQPDPPTIDTSDVVMLHPGDRLLFVTNGGEETFLALGGDEFNSSFVALTKYRMRPTFEAEMDSAGRVLIRLDEAASGPDVSGPDPDPPPDHG